MDKDFPAINAARTLEKWRNPDQVKAIGVESAEYYYNSDYAWLTTLINFLMETGLLADASAISKIPIEQVKVMMSDLTEEGRGFFMSGAKANWLGSLDRKSNDMLRRGISNEERVKARQDPKGLHKRLEQFRKNPQIRFK